mgnify:CR=1 FL=1
MASPKCNIIINSAFELKTLTEDEPPFPLPRQFVADIAGGDARCSCRTDPVPETEMDCRHRSAHVAYIAAARPEDPVGEGHSDGEYSLFIDVDDENTQASESPNPVTTLRMRYDALASRRPGRTSCSWWRTSHPRRRS